jgi:hypothetical protein
VSLKAHVSLKDHAPLKGRHGASPPARNSAFTPSRESPTLRPDPCHLVAAFRRDAAAVPAAIAQVDDGHI